MNTFYKDKFDTTCWTSTSIQNKNNMASFRKMLYSVTSGNDKTNKQIFRPLKPPKTSYQSLLIQLNLYFFSVWLKDLKHLGEKKTCINYKDLHFCCFVLTFFLFVQWTPSKTNILKKWNCYIKLTEHNNKVSCFWKHFCTKLYNSKDKYFFNNSKQCINWHLSLHE